MRNVPKKNAATEVGILVFLLRQPIPPFHPYFGGLKVITDEGASEKWWAHKDLHVRMGGDGWRRKAVMVEDQACESFCVAGAVFGESQVGLIHSS